MSRYTYNKQGWNSPKFSRGRKQLVKNLILFAIALGFAGSLFLVGVMAFVSRQLPNPNSLTERSISQTTKIYDRTGEHLLYEIFGSENRTLKKVQEGFCKNTDDIDTDKNGIPLFALQATIAAEDRSFCKHSGFDIKGIVRAFLENLRGNRVGGSTLTQQLVKNAILSNEKTVTRKIKELMLSIELERRYSKDEILQIYFNEIPYGSTYYGIEAASQNLFKKSVNQLTLAEAATLAALPKAPTTYLNNPDRLLARRDYILNEMKDLGFITEEQLVSAKKEITPVKIQLVNIEAPHFVLYVKEQLEQKFGQQVAEAGGLKVITSLNFDYQKIAEEELEKHVNEKGPGLKFSNAALVAIDPKNGQILSMVGSKDFFDETIDGQVNVATRLRQPGSSFKPIVYSKAFELGYTPNTILWDVLTDFPTVTGTYTPHNYDLKEHGPVRLRDALQLSLNIPAVKMLYMVGVENALDFATSLGYTSFGDHSAFGLSLVLGGGEVKLLEHVNAYAAFANEGKQFEPISILKIEDSNGETLEEWKQKEGKKVMDENIARTITNVLSDNNARSPVFGLNSPLQLGDRLVAAKTGTTNNNRDAWLLGYTPSLVVGVWAGNNNNTEMTKSAGG
ncbi:transglycosylase domain-containing protein, partial [Candidatus Uhrbacteria bacterium]|nr:transglycosylase domain-containing protein [Candidatus Uhrbacteria bacterium]